MAIQMNAATRNARLDTIESTNGTSCALEIRTGAQPADCAAASGSKAKSGTWQDTSADATGTAAHFRVFNSQVTKDGTTCFMQGSVGQGSGDLSLDNTAIGAGQQVTINTFTLTSGN